MIMQVWDTIEVHEYQSGGNNKNIFMRLRQDLHAAFQTMLSRKGVSESSLTAVLFIIRSLSDKLLFWAFIAVCLESASMFGHNQVHDKGQCRVHCLHVGASYIF